MQKMKTSRSKTKKNILKENLKELQVQVYLFVGQFTNLKENEPPKVHFVVGQLSSHEDDVHVVGQLAN